MHASRTTRLVIAALVALLVIVGWAMYASDIRYQRQEAGFAEERAQLSGQIEQVHR